MCPDVYHYHFRLTDFHVVKAIDPGNKEYDQQFKLIRSFKEHLDKVKLEESSDDEDEESSSSTWSLSDSNFKDFDDEMEEKKDFGKDGGEGKSKKARKRKPLGYKKIKVYKHVLDRGKPYTIPRDDGAKTAQPRNASMNVKFLKQK